MMVTNGARHFLTAAEFLEHPAAITGTSELVRGSVRMMIPASGAHGLIAGIVFAGLNTFVEARQLGMCFPDNTGFQLPGLGDTVRSPDVAFVRADQLPPGGIGSGWIQVAPDLVVEILSPSEKDADLIDKLNDYRAAGTRLVWVIDPARRTVAIRSGDRPERLLGDSGVIEGEDVLPGFELPVERLFARLAR